MRCPQCGHDNGAELKLCGECGTRLALLCPNVARAIHLTRSSVSRILVRLSDYYSLAWSAWSPCWLSYDAIHID
jgi:hypothetical protein